jgi:hypothetical protein
MTYQEKNIVVSFCSQIIILGFFLVRIFQIAQGRELEAEKVFRLWLTVIILEIVVTILGTILAHILSAIVQSIQNGGEEPEIDSVEDERDKLIGLKGSRIAYIASSLGIFIAMLVFAFGQPALVMFSLIILAGIVAQIISDISKLFLYRRGF